MSRDGRWIAFCQARADTDGNGKISTYATPCGGTLGDRMDLFLGFGPGPGSPIDGLVATEPSGRYVVVLRHGGQLILMDTLARAELDLSALGADTREDGQWVHGLRRPASFDPSGSRLLYLRGADARTKVVVRDLTSGLETLIDPGPGELWRARFVSNDWISLDVVTRDIDGNGKLEWPPTSWNGPHGQICNEPAAAPRVSGRDETTMRVVAARGGRPREVSGFVGMLGTDFVRRLPDEALVLEAPSGAVRPLAPAACGARIQSLDSEHRNVLVQCTAGRFEPGSSHTPFGMRSGKPAPFAMYGSLGARRFTFTHPANDWDNEGPFGRLATIWIQEPVYSKVIVDMTTGATLVLGAKGAVFSLFETRALVLDDGRAKVLDLAGGQQTDLPGTFGSEPVAVSRDGRFAAIVSVVTGDPVSTVVDLANTRIVGRTRGYPTGVTADGRVLVPAGGFLPREGPLRWETPTP